MPRQKKFTLTQSHKIATFVFDLRKPNAVLKRNVFDQVLVSFRVSHAPMKADVPVKIVPHIKSTTATVTV